MSGGGIPRAQIYFVLIVIWPNKFRLIGSTGPGAVVSTHKSLCIVRQTGVDIGKEIFYMPPVFKRHMLRQTLVRYLVQYSGTGASHQQHHTKRYRFIK